MELAYAINLIPSIFEKSLLFIMMHWFAMTGTLLNPLIYAWWNDHFRRQLKHTVRRYSNWSTNIDRSKALYTSELHNNSRIVDYELASERHHSQQSQPLLLQLPNATHMNADIL